MRKNFLLMIMALLFSVGAFAQLQVTVGSNTTSLSYAPSYQLYNYSTSEQIIPASAIVAPAGLNEIKGISFYKRSGGSATRNVNIYVKATSKTAFSSASDWVSMSSSDLVYSGTLSTSTNGWNSVLFNNSIVWDRTSNLLICVDDNSGSWTSSVAWGAWTPVSGSYSTIYHYSDTQNLNPLNLTTSANGRSYTADYIQLNFSVGDTPFLSVTPNPIEMGYRPIGYWMRPMTVNVSNLGADANINGMDVSDSFFTMDYGDLEFPFAMAFGEDADVEISTGETNTPGEIHGSFVVSYAAQDRTALLVDLTATAYVPVCPDVWELARVVSSYPYTDRPDESAAIYDNYLLPGTNEDGHDAVYKLTITEDKLLNASVTEGEDPKIALYAEDFYGQPGPGVDNYYQGIPLVGNSGFTFDQSQIITHPAQGYNGADASAITAGGTSFGPNVNWAAGNGSYYRLADDFSSTSAFNLNTVKVYAYQTGSSTTSTITGMYLQIYNGDPMNGGSVVWGNNTTNLLSSTSFINAYRVTSTTLTNSARPIMSVTASNLGISLGAGTYYLAVGLTGSLSSGPWGMVQCIWDDPCVGNMEQQNTSSWTPYLDGSNQKTLAMYLSDETERSNYNGSNEIAGSNEVSDVMTPEEIASSANYQTRDNEYPVCYGGNTAITNVTLAPGTYYLVASSTTSDFVVNIDTETIPCPVQASGAIPADNADDVTTPVTLHWTLGQFTTQYRLVFGSTYYCEDVLVDWTSDLSQSYTVSDLYNNTNYFWRIDERNSECTTQGEVWGFTTTLNIPTNLRANSTAIYEGDNIVLTWNPIQDRTHRHYRVYQDGVQIAETAANVTTYTVSGLTYNMTNGYCFNVTAVYDEGESDYSNTVCVNVSGEGSVSGGVYEQDSVTGIAGATVTFTGQDEFGVARTYSFTTNANGLYSGDLLAGTYDGKASCEGYQDVNYFDNPVTIAYNTNTPEINFVMDEVFYPVGEVIAEYYPDSLDPESPYVKVYWSWNVMSNIIEDFETGDFSNYDWNNTVSNYPWTISTNNPYEGTYCMKSGNAGVGSSSSAIQVEVEIPRDANMSFFGKISSESGWDYGRFYIDGTQMGQYSGTSSWGEKTFAVTEGTHTFKWEYSKDGSVNSGEDCWYVDYINFCWDPEPFSGSEWITYDNGNYYTNVGYYGNAVNWGCLWPASTMSAYAGCNLTKVSMYSEPDGYTGGSYTVTIYKGGTTEPGTAVSTQTVTVPSSTGTYNEFTLNTPVAISGTENIWIIWSASGIMYPAPACSETDPALNGSWWNSTGTWSQLTYGAWMTKAYVTNRSGRSMELSADVKQTNEPIQVSLPVSAPCGDIQVTNTVKPEPKAVATPGNSRSFQYFRVYRTDCYNFDYTAENTQVLCCELHDTLYIDVSWPDAAPGVYKWGVGCVYAGNRESAITWAEPTVVPANVAKPEMDAETYAMTCGLAPKTGNQNVNPAPETLRGDIAYACNAYGGTLPTGWISYDIDNPSAGTSLNSGLSIFGGDYCADGYVHAYNNTNVYYKIDPTTGNVISTANANAFMVDCAYDFSTGTLFGSYGGTLYSCDLETGYATQIGSMGVTAMQVLACSTDGQLYGISYGDPAYLYSINKTTGAATQIGSTGQSCYYVQSGGFNHNTGTMYWAGYGNTGFFASVDLTSGHATVLASNTGEQLSWCIPYTPSNPGGGNGLQEPRESEIVWSNCLDKDMWFNGGGNGNVDITVLTNSTDSPAGTVVTLNNLNEYEAGLGYNYSVTLDESGHYVWDEFRRGSYSLSISLAGFSPITVDSLAILEPTSLRYVLEEIIYNVTDLYVSHTGWAMWTGQGTPGGGGGGGGTGDEFTEDFEGGGTGIFTSLDADGDGYGWEDGNALIGAGYGHSSNGFVLSRSYVNGTGPLNPNNFLVSPQVNIGSSSTFTFYACAQDASYPAEHFGVAISTSGNTNASDFTTIQEWTMTAKNAKAVAGPRGTNAQGSWHQYTVDLSAYAGQQCYIAIRHFNCTDQFYLDVDDVALTNGAKDGRHLEQYKVMCTSVDNTPIWNANTTNNFCQVATDQLVAGETYICKVASVYTTGMSDWQTVEWVYEPCEGYEGTTNGVTGEWNNENVILSWDYPSGGGGGGGGGGTGDEFTQGFEGGLNGWTNIDADSDGEVWYPNTECEGSHCVLSIDSHGGTGHLCSESYCNCTGALNPNNFLVSPQKYSIGSGSTFSFYACAQDAAYAAEHFGVAISTSGNTSASDFTTIQEWTLTAKGVRLVKPDATRDGKGTLEGNWYQFTADLSAYAGQQVWIAIRHFNVSDQFIICVDDLELSNGAKATSAVLFDQSEMITNPGAGANGADVSALQGAQSTYGPAVNWNAGSGAYYLLADDFTLDASSTINDITVYGYQTGSGNNSTITGLYLQIYNGSPMSGGTVVWGNNSTNLLSTTQWSHIYRTTGDNLTDTNRPIMEVTASNLGIDLEAGHYWLQWGITGSGSSGPWGAPRAIVGQTNTGDGLQNTGSWAPLSDTGSGDPYGLAMSISGTTSGGGGGGGGGATGAVLGAVIFRDGEYLGFTTESTYTDLAPEAVDHEYCVRIVYDGTAVLPAQNEYYSMSCPECVTVTGEITCEPGQAIRGEYEWNAGNDFGALISWGTQVEPIAEWLYYDNGTLASAIGAGGTLYWGIMIPAANLTAYAGCSLTQVALMEYSDAGTYTLNIYYGGSTAPQTLVHTQAVTVTGTQDWNEITLTSALPLDVTQNLWITFYQSGITYPAACCANTGDANGRWVSTDGAEWGDLMVLAPSLAYTWMVRGFVTNEAKGGEIVALPEFQGNKGAELQAAPEVNVPTQLSFMNRAELVKYNVYRSTSNSNYALVGSVPYVAGQTYYEYYDAVNTMGTYYYQVTAVYDNDCESEPAVSEANASNNYVIVNVTDVNENVSEVSLYPNPTNGNVTIEAAGMNHVTVISALGQVIYDAQVDNDMTTLNMAQFKAGVYMVRINTENGMSVKRVTVVR